MGGYCVQVTAGPASGATRWNNFLRVWRILRQRWTLPSDRIHSHDPLYD